jgi:hypothetical protein
MGLKRILWKTLSVLIVLIGVSTSLFAQDETMGQQVSRISIG